MEREEVPRSYLVTIFSCRCPRCREGKLFKHPVSVNIRRNMEMNEYCTLCSQPTDIEVGFYYGTSYISYLISLAICAISFFIWWLIIGFSFHDSRFLYWIIFNSVSLLLLQPWLMRFSRSLWLSFFVRFDPEWKHKRPDNYERIIESEMNNW